MSNDDLYVELTDAGRTALEIVRRERAGDMRGIADLVCTYSDDGKGLIVGAMASVTNYVLTVFDALASSHGEIVRGDDVIDAMSISLPPSGSGPRHG